MIINRKELWIAAIAFIFYLLSLPLIFISIDNLALSQMIAGIGDFFQKTALFLGGVTVSIFATPYARAHVVDSLWQTIIIYAIRLTVGSVFLLSA